MQTIRIRNVLLLLLTALIWGVAFVAQKSGGDEIGAFSFNGVRSVIGGIFLLLIIKIRDRLNGRRTAPETPEERRLLVRGGVWCGVILFFASMMQQLGLYFGANAGTAGFLTACYIVLVPIFGLFLKKRCPWNTWIGVPTAVVGLYLLCMSGSFSLKFHDAFVLVSAVLFAIHILVIDRFSPWVDGVRLSCIQFFVCGALCVIPMIAVDIRSNAASLQVWLSAFALRPVWISVLYAGILSCGIGYTLQIVAQKNINPTVASMVLSLESVFSVLAGWLLLNETMTARNLLGCGLIFGAILFVQLPVGQRKEKGTRLCGN